jgi:two-component system, cell cycle response regulator CtrA
MRVLIIEDNNATAKTIELALATEGIIADIATLGQDGIEVNMIYDYDLVVLDLMLPDMNGFEVLKKIRNAKKEVPVLILSGLSDTEGKIKGLGYGADDYLTKPFNMAELVARVKAIIRRSKGHAESSVEVGDLVINFDHHTALIGTKPVHLTNKEQSVLELLAMRKEHVVTKEQFINHLYNGLNEPELKIIDVFVCKLRRKIFDVAGENYIETVWGRGYILKKPSDVAEDQRKVVDAN